MAGLCRWKSRQPVFSRRGSNKHCIYDHIFCREVKIIRLISKDTVEEAMLRCGKEKLKLEHDITTSDDTGIIVVIIPKAEWLRALIS